MIPGIRVCLFVHAALCVVCVRFGVVSTDVVGLRAFVPVYLCACVSICLCAFLSLCLHFYICIRHVVRNLCACVRVSVSVCLRALFSSTVLSFAKHFTHIFAKATQAPARAFLKEQTHTHTNKDM